MIDEEGCGCPPGEEMSV